MGARLIDVYGGETPSPRAQRRLADMVALGEERTIEQDPAFAIRILVDVANLALSPAVNDPTTAVQVLDYLGETLRLVGTTELSVQTWEGARSQRGVVVPARSWEDYLSLSTDEIREYGAGGIQIMRRLRALLEELRDEVRPEYRAAVTEELLRSMQPSRARGSARSISTVPEPLTTKASAGHGPARCRATDRPHPYKVMLATRLRGSMISDDERSGAVAVRDDEHLPLPVRPGHDRAGVPGGAVTDGVLPQSAA